MVGLGKSADFSLDKVRQAAGTATRVVQGKKFKNPSILLYRMETQGDSPGRRYPFSCRGYLIVTLQFHYVQDIKEGRKNYYYKLLLVVQKKDVLEKVKSVVKKTEIVADAVCFTRDIVNMAGSDATAHISCKRSKRDCKEQRH